MSSEGHQGNHEVQRQNERPHKISSQGRQGYRRQRLPDRVGADRTLGRECGGPAHQERGYNLSHGMNESSCPAIGRRVGICEEDDAKHDGDEPEQRKWIRENTAKRLSANRIETARRRVWVEQRFTGDPVSHSSREAECRVLPVEKERKSGRRQEGGSDGRIDATLYISGRHIL